jgi:hypothetical protein
MGCRQDRERCYVWPIMRRFLPVFIALGSVALLIACSGDDDTQSPAAGSSSSSSSSSSSGAATSSSSSSSSSGSSAATPVTFETLELGKCKISYDGKTYDGNAPSEPPKGGSEDGTSFNAKCAYTDNAGESVVAQAGLIGINGPGTYESSLEKKIFGSGTFSFVHKDGTSQNTPVLTLKATLTTAGGGIAVGGAQFDVNGKPVIISFNLKKE